MPYGSYRGQCVGRLIHFLYKTNWNLGECSFFGDGVIHADPHGKILIATFSWNNDDDGDIPIIKFTEKYQHFQENYEKIKQEIVEQEKNLGKLPFSLKRQNEEEEKERKMRQDKLFKQIMESSYDT